MVDLSHHKDPVFNEYWSGVPLPSPVFNEKGYNLHIKKNHVHKQIKSVNRIYSVD